MNLFRIREVSIAPIDGGLLWGRSIDVPKEGSLAEAGCLEVMGWVLGKASAARVVEFLVDGRIVRRTPVNVPRPDVRAHFSSIPGADRSGFQTKLNFARGGDLEVGVRAVLKDGALIPLGSIRLAGLWRGEEKPVSEPLVSIIIPCFKQAHFLSEAIESALAQTYRNIEIVVIDDGSPDNASEVASRYPDVRCVRQENEGLSGARNTGIRRSNGLYLLFLDSDDRLPRDAVASHLECFRRHPESAFVSGRHRVIALDGSLLGDGAPPRPEPDSYIRLLRERPIMTPGAVLFRRALFEKFLFDSELKSCQDYLLYLQVAQLYPFVAHDAFVVEYRRHGSNLGGNPELTLKEIRSVFRSQRRFVRRNPRYRRDHRLGLKSYMREYGLQIVESVDLRVKEGDWRGVAQGIRVLARYWPFGIALFLKRLSVTRPWRKGT